MKQWKDLVERIITEGVTKDDRTGVGTLSVFGGHMQFDLRDRFPVLQTKETRWKVAFLEMLWFLRGETHVHYLHKHGCKLWDAWSDSHGNVGPIYGAQWRNWNGDGEVIDQVSNVVLSIKRNPESRRHIVSAWNASEIYKMGLPPCHWAHQLYVDGDWIDMQVNQRSWDVALGAPFNIAQYALLLHLYARATSKKPRHLHFSYGDAHIYLDHVLPMRRLLNEDTLSDDAAQIVFMTDNTNIDGYKPDDFCIVGYEPGPFIKLDVAV